MRTDPRGGHNRKKIDKDFFKKWSPPMAYMLGLIFSDGTVEDCRKSSRTCYIAITTKDKSLIDQVKTTLSSHHKIYVKKSQVNVFPGNKKYLCSEQFVLRIASKKMYSDLIKLGLTPRKSLTIELPYIPKEYFSFFLRGYFDGDGCVGIYPQKGRKALRLRVIFTCGSLMFLEKLTLKISNCLNTHINKISHSNGAYQSRYSKQDGLKILNFMYKDLNQAPYLNRKYKIFQNTTTSLSYF